MTIEERAREIVYTLPRTGKTYYAAYVHGAKDQDRIARAEERERCIMAACEQYRKELVQIVRVMNLSRKGSGGIIDIDGSVDDFRKALEGGEG